MGGIVWDIVGIVGLFVTEFNTGRNDAGSGVGLIGVWVGIVVTDDTGFCVGAILLIATGNVGGTVVGSGIRPDG